MMSFLTLGVPSTRSHYREGLELHAELSPAGAYRELVQRINAEFEEKKMNRSNFQGTIPLRVESTFQQGKDAAFAVVKTAATCGVLGTIGAYALFRPKPSIVSLQAAASPKETHSAANRRHRVFIVGAAAFISSGAASLLYHKLATKIRSASAKVYDSIEDNKISQESLLTLSEDSIREKEASYFGKIFEYFNPTSMCYLFLAKGIALDSSGKFDLAQEQYEIALNYRDPKLRDIIHVVYARSLRLSKNTQAALEQISKIRPTNASMRRLGEIEEQCIHSNIDEIIDSEDGIPFELKCPITQSLMVHPTFYEDGHHRHYFENSAIVEWVCASNTCPFSRKELRVDELMRDITLADAICVWKKIRLKIRR